MPLLHHTAAAPDFCALHHALATLAPGAPVIVMVHGYKFSPGDQRFCPHGDILSLTPKRRARAVSWPRHLGVGRSGAGPEPLCIAFGWNSRGTIWRAWRAARRAGADLAALLTAIQAHGRGPTGVIAHSLGARVALYAMRRAPARSIGRTVLIAGAAFRGNAQRAMASAAGQTAEVLNVTSSENAFYDTVFEVAVGHGRRSVGRGLQGALPRWLDLPIDTQATRDGLSALGHRIGLPERRMCHWSGYLRPGMFGLYRRWLTGPAALPLGVLAAHLPEPRRPLWRLPARLALHLPQPPMSY